MRPRLVFLTLFLLLLFCSASVFAVKSRQSRISERVSGSSGDGSVPVDLSSDKFVENDNLILNLPNDPFGQPQVRHSDAEAARTWNSIEAGAREWGGPVPIVGGAQGAVVGAFYGAFSQLFRGIGSAFSSDRVSMSVGCVVVTNPDCVSVVSSEIIASGDHKMFVSTDASDFKIVLNSCGSKVEYRIETGEATRARGAVDSAMNSCIVNNHVDGVRSAFVVRDVNNNPIEPKFFLERMSPETIAFLLDTFNIFKEEP